MLILFICVVFFWFGDYFIINLDVCKMNMIEKYDFCCKKKKYGKDVVKKD